METKIENNNSQLELAKKDISAQVLARVDIFQKSGELRIPKDYSAENALKSAYLILTDPRNNLLEQCNKQSIANALLKMVVWGLSPLKKQCDFIKYGDKLECSPEYTGNIILAKRYGGLKSIKANAIFEGDVFEFTIDTETGRKKIIKHEQTLESIGSKNLKGAYAVYTMQDGSTDVEIMNIQQIHDSWNQGATKGASPAHKNFPDQMAMKTVISRACKMLLRSSDDSILYSGDVADEQPDDVSMEIADNANGEVIGFETSATDDAEQNVESVEKEVRETEAIEPSDIKQASKAVDLGHKKAIKVAETIPGF